MKNLTKREKILMYVLVYILIIVGGGFLLCMPAFESYSSLKSEYDTIETQWMTEKAGVIEYRDLDKQIEDATNAYNEQIKNFYVADQLQVEDIDALLTTFSLEHNLKPMSLQISDIVEEEVMNYKDFIQEEANKTKADETNTAQEESAIETTTAKVYRVSLTVTGTMPNLQSMINDASALKTLKVSDVTYTTQEDAIKTMTITFKIYMI